MTRIITRRNALIGTGALATASLITSPAILRGQAAMPRVTYVTLATGFNVILNEFMAAKRFDLKHGVNIDVIKSYVSVTNYYNDFTAGTFEIGIGAWDTWASRYLAGVPLKVVSTVTDYDMLYIVAMQGGPKTVEDLRGKTLSATLSSGAYRVTKHALSAFHKMEADKDYKVQNTESPAGAVAMVLGGSAEGGLTWEPYFAIAVRDEAEKRHPGVSKLISAAFNDCIRGVMENPEEAAKLSAAKMKVSEAALLSAFTSKRLVFRPAAMSDAVGREKLVKAAEYMTKNGMLEKTVPAGFIAS